MIMDPSRQSYPLRRPYYRRELAPLPASSPTNSVPSASFVPPKSESSLQPASNMLLSCRIHRPSDLSAVHPGMPASSSSNSDPEGPSDLLESGQGSPVEPPSKRMPTPSSSPPSLPTASDLSSKSTKPLNQTVNGSLVAASRRTGNGVHSMSAVAPAGHQQQQYRHHQAARQHENAGERESAVLALGSTGSSQPSHHPPPLSSSQQQSAVHSLSGIQTTAASGSTGSAAAALHADPLNAAAAAASAATGAGVAGVGAVCMKQQLTGSSAAHCKSQRAAERRGERESGATGETGSNERERTSPDVVLLAAAGRSLPSSSSTSSLAAVGPGSSSGAAAATSGTTTTSTTKATATTTAIAAAVAAGSSNSGTSDSHRQIGRLRRFLTTLHQFTCDIGPEVGEKVHALILNLVNCTITIEDFHQKIQEITQYPLRAYVVPFLRLHLPIVQNEIMLCARLSKLTPSQYLLQNESLILDLPLGVNASSRSSHSSSRHSTSSPSSIPPILIGEAFEIFQPAIAERSSPSSAATTSNQSVHSSRHHQTFANSPTTAMGIKDGSQMSAKRRLSPESRKENGFDDHHSQSHHLHHHQQQHAQHPDAPAAKRHQMASVISPNYIPRSHMLPTSNSGPLHPLHSNASVSAAATSVSPAASASSSSGQSSHSSQISARAALMEQAAHEAAVAAAGIFRVTNGGSSPPVPANGLHAGRESLSNGRSPGSLDHHLIQLSERFERDRVYSSLEKELFSRNGVNHSKILLSSYPDVVRSYSEELTRETEEEWRNIHTMLNCILGMVDKTKRALAILQQRTMENAANIWTPGRSIAAAAAASRMIPSPVQNSFHTPNHISLTPAAAAAHQQQSLTQKSQQSNTLSPPTIIKQINRNDVMPHSQSSHAVDQRMTPDSMRLSRQQPGNNRDAMSEVKRQAVAELQKAVSAAECKANELVAVERAKMERLISEARRQAAEEAVLSVHRQEDSSESCWNCGRKAAETCSGCNVARYCGSFCQHKDWETHHRVCGQGVSLCASSSSNLNTSSESANSSPSTCNTSAVACNPVSVASVVAAAAAAAVVASAGGNSSSTAADSRARIRGSPSPPVIGSRHPVKICINDKN